LISNIRNPVLGGAA